MDDISPVRRIDLGSISASERLSLLQDDDGHCCDDDRIRQTIAAVRKGGDDVLSRLGMERHGIDLEPSELQIVDGDFVHAYQRLAPECTRRLDETVNRIRDFHEAEMPQELWLKQVRPGQWAGHRHRPIASTACYVPRGSDVRSEAAVMNAIPALVAEVPRVVIVTPPEPDGSVSDLILVAAATVGVGEIYKLDAMAASAALSLGTERVPRVCRMMAPYDPVLVKAKRILTDDLDIIATGGRAKAVLLADAWAHADAVNTDLLAASEMIGDGSVLLVSPSADLLDAVAKRWPDQHACDFVLAPSMAVALSFVNESDPAYLSVFTVDPMSVISSIDIAGEVELKGSQTTSLLSPVGHDDQTAVSRLPCRSSFSVFDFLERTPINYRSEVMAPNTAEDAERAGAFDRAGIKSA